MKSFKKVIALLLTMGLIALSVLASFASTVSDVPGEPTLSTQTSEPTQASSSGEIGPGFSSSSGSSNTGSTSDANVPSYGDEATTSSDGTVLPNSPSTSLTGSNLSNTDVSISPSAVTVDPITGNAPLLHGQYLLSSGNLTEGFTTNMGAYNSSEEGFVGIKFRMEYSIGDVYYRVYRDGMGWGNWAMNEMITPFNGEPNKVTALQVRINGHTANQYNLYYRVVLNDGSVLGWARDGQTSGTIGTGLYIQQVQIAYYPRGQAFPEATDNYFYADHYEGLLENSGGIPSYSTWDASAYTGWAYDTENNKYYFSNGTATVGWAYVDGYKYYFDDTGKVVTDLEPIIGLTGDYILKLNKAMKTLTVYTRDGDNGYILPVKVILTTVGPDTPIGTFRTYASYRWKYMHDDIYCQFLLRFKDGCLMHSVIYNGAPSSYRLNAATYNQLGKNQSDGCVRMVAGNACWIYTNCGVGTQLTIYNDGWVTGPFDRPAIEQGIPLTQNYDPTDPVVIAKAQENAAAQSQALAQEAQGETEAGA